MKKLLLVSILLSWTIVFALTPQECVKEFKLTGKVYDDFDTFTLNKWNNALPKVWQDKGGHFLARMKEKHRGQAASLYTPSDLQSFVMGGELVRESIPDRYSIQRIEGKLYKVIFDINNKSKKCELVTFIISQPPIY